MTLTVYDQEYWDCKEQFLATFMPLAEEFYELQLSKFTRPTAQNYSIVASSWIEYLHDSTDCFNFGDITVGQTNSQFFATLRYHNLYGFDSKEVKNKLKVFIAFLKEKGYQNDNVDKAIAKK